MKRNKTIALFAIPMTFFIVLLFLNSHLNASVANDKKIHLISAHGGASKRFQNDHLKLKEVLDFTYDLERLAALGLVQNTQDESLKSEGEKLNAFNDLISSRLSLNRELPDTRHPLCHDEIYRSDLPKASVIICFYNEAWSTLLRTVHSVINRTPPNLLYEIVLVDDASSLNHLQNKLAEYLWALHPNITLVRTPERQGLIRARMYGAYVATGEVLVFLDSHCEVNHQWLEPLLKVVTGTKKSTIAVPVIDSISSGSFEYTASKVMKGGFNWGLNFKWDEIPADFYTDDASHIRPVETPTMAGGLFAVTRVNFIEMGEYDAAMDTWGGENLEISFRFWLCGGQLLIVPCSRVGHVFRNRRPYGSPNGEDSMLKNSLRVAKVWMDDYIQYFFQMKPYATDVKTGDLTERMEIKNKLTCKPFQWYLKYIYPEQTIPGKDGQVGSVGRIPEKYKPVYLKQGPIIHKQTGLCIVPEGAEPERGGRLVLETCDTGEKKQVWYQTELDELMMTEKLCMGAQDNVNKGSYVKLMKCTGLKGTQAWSWTIRNVIYQIYNPTSGKCLSTIKVEDRLYLVTAICDMDSNTQFTMKTAAR